jgi:hypothetical protein
MQIFDFNMVAILAGQDGWEAAGADSIKQEVRQGVVGSTGTINLGTAVIPGSVQVSEYVDGAIVRRISVPESAITYATGEITGLDPGLNILVVFNTSAIGLDRITINADKFAGSLRLVMEAFIRPASGAADELVQIEMPDARPQAGLTLTFSEAVTELTITYDVMQDANNGDMVYITKVGAQPDLGLGVA